MSLENIKFNIGIIIIGYLFGIGFWFAKWVIEKLTQKLKTRNNLK